MPARTLRTCAAACLAAVFGCALSACEPPQPKPAVTPAQPSAAPAKVYTVKGRIEQLPDPAVKGSMFQVHHQDIPDFVNRDGKAVGMNAMTMPFPPADGVSLESLAVGDEIELTFEIRWDRMPPQRATAIKKLPPKAP